MTSEVRALPTSVVQLGQARRELQGELIKIRDFAESEGFFDEATQKLDGTSLLIKNWAINFLKALKLASEEEVCPTYIELLQEILIDPYTEAPLDSPVLFGNDGHTYGKMSYEIAFFSRPEEIRNRSPMKPEDPTRFCHVKHPVAEYMLGWLDRRGERLVSEELVRMHARVVPQVDTLTNTSEKISFLLARQRASYLTDFEHRLARIAVHEEKAFELLENENVQTAQQLQATQTQLQVIQAEEERAKNLLKARIEEHMQAQVQARSVPATASTAQTMANLGQLSVQARQALEQLKQKRETLEGQIEHLEKENKEIKECHAELVKNGEELKQKVIQLRETIVETKIAIKKARRNNALEAIAWVAGSAFGTWAIQAWLASSTFGVSVIFDAKKVFFHAAVKV